MRDVESVNVKRYSHIITSCVPTCNQGCDDPELNINSVTLNEHNLSCIVLNEINLDCDITTSERTRSAQLKAEPFSRKIVTGEKYLFCSESALHSRKKISENVIFVHILPKIELMKI